MKHQIRMVLAITLVGLVGCQVPPVSEDSPPAADRPPAVGASDYTHAYWLNSWRKSSRDKTPNILCLETGRYGFELDIANLAQPRFGLLDDGVTYTESVVDAPSRLHDLAAAALNVTVAHDGKIYRLAGCWAGDAGGGPVDVRQWESGQIAQHYDILGLRFEDDAGNQLGCYSTLDLVAWPDSLTFNLTLMPDFIYADGPSEGVVGSGRCVFNQPVDIPHDDNLDSEQLTVECWVKRPETLPFKGRWFLSKNGNEWVEGNFGFRWGLWAPSAVMNIGGGRDHQYWVEMDGHDYRQDDWNHLVLTYDGNVMKAYLNGNLQGTQEIGQPRVPGRGSLRIGQRQDGKHGILQGFYDQVRIWNRPLTEEEIRAHAEQPDTIPDRDGLVLEENFEADKSSPTPAWTDATVRLAFSGASRNWQHEQAVAGEWSIGEQKTFTLNCNLDDPGPADLPVTIQLSTPDGRSLVVPYEPALNAHAITSIRLNRPDRGGDPMTDYDDFDLVVDAAAPMDKPVPFYLHLKGPASISGVIPMLCHEDGSPTGIPVQLSKNWHHASLGPYLRVYTLLPVKQGPTRYKLRVAYCGYGTLPPVSHAQLSLIGYAGNQRWDQLALGCGGELITFNPDASLSGGPEAVCDVRLSLVKYGTDPNPWIWSDAGWGGDWLSVRDDNNRRLNFAAMKVGYLAHGPCLSDVVYHGTYGSDGSVTIDARIQLPRTDDYGRTFQKLEYHFQRELNAADTYLMRRNPSMFDGVVAYGNADGLIAEKSITGDLKKGDLLVPPTTLEGPGPWWVAFPKRSRRGVTKEWPIGYVSLVIRDYQAEFGGQTHHQPTLQVRIADREENEAKLDTRFVPPPEIKTYQPGDRVMLDTEWVHLVTTADEFGGFNDAFRKHLEENPRSWKTTYREVRGNNLRVKVSGGELLNRYPIIVQARGPQVSVDIRGGVGFVPIRFEGLASATGYALYEQVDGREIRLDQSVHGNDGWQADYDAARGGSYKLTFNLPLDGKKTSRWVLRRQD